jgi:serine phosphatase RsbU (regulator of sigma subunit)
MSQADPGGREWRLGLATFLGVFLSILGVGLATVPFLLSSVERAYYRLQADVNARQVRAMSQFVQARLAAGADMGSVVQEFQAAVEGTQTDRGYLCLIDQTDARYLGHPDLESLGMAVKPFATFDPDFSGRAEELWQEHLKRGESAAGLLEFGPGMPIEIVYFASVPDTQWTLSSHENAGRIQAEVASFRRTLALAATVLGLLLALPASVVARQIGRRSERRLEERNELEHRVIELENARKTQELDEARRLQLSLLPTEAPEHPEVECAGLLRTATEVGGDYYDFHLGEDNTLSLAVGDATGHGAQAGVLVVAAKSLFLLLAGERDLAVALSRASEVLRRMGLPRLHLALVLGKLRGRTLELAGSGMPPALVYRARDASVEEIPLDGTPLGSPIRMEARTSRIELAPGDTVLLMSDGFPEAPNSENELFGYERVVESFGAVAASAPEEITRQLMSTVERWSALERPDGSVRPPQDDVTFLVLKVPDAPRFVG